MTAPLFARWDGEALAPLARFAKECDVRLVIGQTYRVEVIEDRSDKSHRAYFAAVKEAWASLPEDQAGRWPSPDHLRKFCLIKTGFCKRRDIVCANNSEAINLAATVKELDSYSLTMVSERAVAIWTAESQSYRAMGKKRFGESQDAVREHIARLLDVKAHELPSEEAA